MPGNVSSYLLGPFAAGNAAAIVALNTPAAAGLLAIVGGSPFAMDAPRRVLVTFGNEAAPRTVKITDGSVAETMTIPSGGGGTKATVQDFATVASVQVFGPWTTNMSVGTVSAGGAVGTPVASTPWFFVDINRIPVNVTAGIARLDSSAALTNGYIVEATLDDPNVVYDNLGVISIASSNNPQSNVPPVIFGDNAVVGTFTASPAVKKTANLSGLVAQPYWALRVALYDTTPAQVSAQFIQAGLLGA